MKEHVLDFLTNTYDARALSEKCRDYKDNKQWTPHEVSILTSRGQNPITINRIKNKVQGLVGLLLSRRTDPKAYARTPHHEKASHAISDALRYVKDKNKFDEKKAEVADNFFVEGYGAVFIGEDNKGDPKIDVIPWDRFYYDPHSRRKDFKDARYLGIIIWMDEEEFTSYGWSKKKFEDCLSQEGMGDETFDDRPKHAFTDAERKRVRVSQEYCLKKGTWYEKFFCGDVELGEEVSPYLDEEGLPICPIEAVSAYIDRDNNRFGEVAYYLDLQDEINHRRSKFLAMLSHRQTMSRKGAIEDVNKMKRELSNPRGHVEYKGERGDFDIIPTTDMADGQFLLMQSTMQEMDATTFNAELAGQRQGDLSGRTVEKLQAAGMLTTEDLFFTLKCWEERVYTQIWWRIKESWTEEKWVRVTDDHDQLRYVGFNVQITLQQRLQELSQDKTLPQMQRMQAGMILQQLTQAQAPQLMQPVDVSNPVPELEMDILIEQAPDTINIQNEQFQMIAEIATARPEIPLEWLIKYSQLREKDDMAKELAQMRQQAMAVQQQAMERQEAREDFKVQTDGAKRMAEAQGKQIDNITEQMKQVVLATNPPNEITANV